MLIASAIVLLSSGCAPPTPTQTVALGTLLLNEAFDQDIRWQSYRHPEQRVDFRIEDGVYRAQAWDGGFMWVLYDAVQHDDVVIQVDTEQVSTDRNNAYGVLCRASPTDNGDGYYFLISGDGYYTIRAGTRDGIREIIPWTENAAIQQGRSINRLRIACIGDYLALWINGVFIAETHDSRFRRGFAALTAAAPEDVTVDVRFDALRIWEGQIAP
ncbi:MAG: DUF1080 domain-containing protein [Anaerolinea sp.]|nr:DUF1080 domain-containing protein [Anaerolinea sp.]